MTGGAEIFLNDQGVAELWERIKQELNAKQDKVDLKIATDDEVSEMLDDVFGISGSSGNYDECEIAADDEIEDMLDEVFGVAQGA